MKILRKSWTFCASKDFLRVRQRNPSRRLTFFENHVRWCITLSCTSQRFLGIYEYISPSSGRINPHYDVISLGWTLFEITLSENSEVKPDPTGTSSCHLPTRIFSQSNSLWPIFLSFTYAVVASWVPSKFRSLVQIVLVFYTENLLWLLS